MSRAPGKVPRPSRRRKTAVLFLFILALAAAPLKLQADGDIQWKKSPIRTHWSFWTGMEYSLQGIRLSDNPSFEDAIFPLEDPESTRLLKDSESLGAVAGIGSALGSLGIGWGGFHLLFDDHPSSHGTSVAILLTGAGLDLIGSLLFDGSQSAKFNAVERYNQLVRGEDQALPPTPADEKSLLPASPEKSGR